MEASTMDCVSGNFPIRQINGCRYYGPCEKYRNFTPPRGSEVFIARIPMDYSHKELLKICVRAGFLYDLRLMVTLTRFNRGYAFARYFSPEIAENAISYIHGYPLERNDRNSFTHLVAAISTDHRTLMLTGCPAEITENEVKQFFESIEESDLLSVTKDFEIGQTSPVFYLLFRSHRSAALVRKCNIQFRIPRTWGPWVRLNWQPNSEVHQRLKFKLERRNYYRVMQDTARLLNPNGILEPFVAAQLSNMRMVPVGGAAAQSASTSAQSASTSAQSASTSIQSVSTSAQSAFSLSPDHEVEDNKENKPLLKPNVARQSGTGFGETQGIAQSLSVLTLFSDPTSMASTSNAHLYSNMQTLVEETAPSASTWAHSASTSAHSASTSAQCPQCVFPCVFPMAPELGRNQALGTWTYGNLAPKPESFYSEPEGVWGRAPLLQKNDFSEHGRNQAHGTWTYGNLAPKPESFYSEPEGVWGRAPLLQKNDFSEHGRNQAHGTWTYGNLAPKPESFYSEPKGVWERAPLMAKNDLSGNTQRLSRGEMSNKQPNSETESFSLFSQDDPMEDGHLVLRADEIWSPLGRPIRGRGDDNRQSPKKMRF